MNKFILVSFVLLGLLHGCNHSEEHAKDLLKQMNFTNVRLTGKAFLACSTEDIYQDNFSAIAPNGKLVTGTVCSGIFKSSTIRFD